MADNADNVADDYRQALEDLTVNNRIEIATLTNIARENNNHGLAIAEVLANHIKKVPPARTLPALYVLDSVVKNVPTPYALYFGPKLYSIFMGAYTKVDNATRRKMDEMLKTWKEPVPGSISTKPVFPPEFVSPIEQALVAYRQLAFAATQNSFQGQQQLLRGGRPPVPTRDTPTPPSVRPPSHQAVSHGQQPFPGPNGHPPYMDSSMAQQPYPIRPHHDPAMVQHRGTPQPLSLPADQLPPQQQAVISIDKLKDDIQQLIVAEKREFAMNPLDTSKQARLKALLDLQTIIQSRDMPQDQLMLVKDRVAELAVNMRAAPPPPLMPHTAYTTSTPTPPVAVPRHPVPVPPVAIARPPSVTAGVGPGASHSGGGSGLTLDALLGQGALATLLSAGIPKPATPVGGGFAPSTATTSAAAIAALRSPAPQIPAVQPPPPPVAPTPASSASASSLASNPSALLAMLRQTGLITPAGAGAGVPPPSSASTTPVTGHASLPAKAPVAPHFAAASSDGWSQSRAQMIADLYENLGPPCTQCGRRFRTDDDGRRKKTAHMDWHFQVHQRIAEYEKRGQYRSPFIDELGWIETPVTVDIDYVHPAASGSNFDGRDDNDLDAAVSYTAGSTRKPGHHYHGASSKQSQIQYIPVPEDSSRVNNICPICQERFEDKWLDEAQEWVWMDAVKIGERVFHPSCYREAARDHRDATPSYGARGTPEPVLGKRKAEDDFQSARGKVKVEGGGVGGGGYGY